jgi:hypothetical protein
LIDVYWADIDAPTDVEGLANDIDFLLLGNVYAYTFELDFGPYGMQPLVDFLFAAYELVATAFPIDPPFAVEFMASSARRIASSFWERVQSFKAKTPKWQWTHPMLSTVLKQLDGLANIGAYLPVHPFFSQLPVSVANLRVSPGGRRAVRNSRAERAARPWARPYAARRQGCHRKRLRARRRVHLRQVQPSQARPVGSRRLLECGRVPDSASGARGPAPRALQRMVRAHESPSTGHHVCPRLVHAPRGTYSPSSKTAR